MSQLYLLICLSAAALVIFGLIILIIIRRISIEAKKIKRGDFARGYERDMNETEDEYSKLLKVFGLTDQATDEDIKTAYRKFVKEHHPDSTQDADPERMQRFLEIKKVYDRIVDMQSKRFGGGRGKGL